MPESTSPIDLCTVADVKAFLNLDADDPNASVNDDVIQRLVTAASEMIQREAQREFKTLDGATARSRYFTATVADQAAQRIRTDDLTSLTSATVRDAYGTTIYNPLSSPVLLPRNAPRFGEPYTAIGFPSASPVEAGYELEVLGVWGFPAVPRGIRQDAIVTAATWFARDVEKFSATFALSENRIEIPRTLPSQVQDHVNSYRIWRVS